MGHCGFSCLQEVEEKAKWPEVHGLAAPIWKTAMNRPAQSSALAPNQASWPGAAEAAMQCLALEADKSKVCARIYYHAPLSLL